MRIAQTFVAFFKEETKTTTRKRESRKEKKKLEMRIREEEHRKEQNHKNTHICMFNAQVAIAGLVYVTLDNNLHRLTRRTDLLFF